MIRKNLIKLAAKELKRFGNRIWPYDTRLLRYHNLLWLLDRRNRVDRKIICGGYEEEQVDYLTSLIGEDTDIFLDVGANIGLYTLQIASSRRVEQVYAFEPDPRNYAQLMANLYLNGLATNVIVYRYGASNKQGRAFFEIYPASSTGQSRIQNHDHSDNQLIEIETRTLDSLFDYIDKKIVIKIDVEGHEIATLNGAQHLLSSNRCILQIEAWPQGEEALIEYMHSIGMNHIRTIQEDHYFTNF